MLRRIVEKAENIPNIDILRPFGYRQNNRGWSIIADKTNRKLHPSTRDHLGYSDIKAIIDELDTLLAPSGILLYLDEIQYFQ